MSANPEGSSALYAPEVSLRDTLGVLVERKVVIGAVTFAFTACAVAMALLTTPVYRAEALLVQAQAEETAGLSAIAGQLGGLIGLGGVSSAVINSAKNEYLAVLESRAFTRQFIEEENLLPLLFPEQWNEETGMWATGDGEAPTLSDGVRFFSEAVRGVDEDSSTGLVTLTIDWTDREIAALWAERLVSRLNRQVRERAIVEAQNSLDYLNVELEKTSIVGVRQAIYGLMEAQVNTIMLANVREEYAFRVIDPPSVPEEEDRIRPKRTIMTAIGLALGLMAGILCALVLGPKRLSQFAGDESS
jgi:uncharacterized protein involved in exopolysaccharide biosynthesis